MAENRSEFVIESNYPSREYVRYLEHEKACIHSLIEITPIRQTAAIEELYRKIELIDREISEVKKEEQYYHVMDLLYAGEMDKAEKICTEDALQNCMLALSAPLGTVTLIYVTFTKEHNMKRGQNAIDKSVIELRVKEMKKQVVDTMNACIEECEKLKEQAVNYDHMILENVAAQFEFLIKDVERLI